MKDDESQINVKLAAVILVGAVLLVVVTGIIVAWPYLSTYIQR